MYNLYSDSLLWVKLKNIVTKNDRLSGYYLASKKKYKNDKEVDFWLHFFEFIFKEKDTGYCALFLRHKSVRSMVYAVSLLYNVLAHKFLHKKPTRWWNQVHDLIYLGALPLEKHFNGIVAEGVRNVVSIVEKFEQKKGLLFTPVGKERWTSVGVDNILIENSDFSPVTLSNLYRGAWILKKNIEANEKSYVHCKAGRGRSAALVIAYLCIFGSYTCDDAFNHLKSKRKIIRVKNKLTRIEFMHHFIGALSTKDSELRRKHENWIFSWLQSY
jgi:protein-tyrosine phosphatase